MAKVSMGERTFLLGRFTLQETDIIRIIVIISLSVCAVLISALSFINSLPYLHNQLFLIPIIYAAYFYPRRGIYLAAGCGVVYQTIGYYFRFPDYAAMLEVTFEALLFIVIAVVIAFFIEKVRHSEAQYRTVFEHSQLGIVLFRFSGYEILETNDKFAAMVGHTPQTLRTMRFTDLFVNEQEKERFLERAGQQPAISDFEARFAEPGGNTCWVNLSWNRIDEETISCTAVDINARKLAEKLNNDNMMKYRQLTENSPTGILIILDGNVIYSNPAFSVFSGYSSREAHGRELISFIEPAQRETFGNSIARWNTRRLSHEHAEFRFIAKDGTVRVAIVFANPIIHVGKPAIMINLMDISEKLRLEEQIRVDNERRRGIITTVAHELRTPLQPILGYLNLLLSDAPGFGITDDTKKILERCLVSVDRERQIINQMLELSVLESGKLQLSLSTFPLEPLIHGVVDTSGYIAKADIRVEIPEGLTMTADRERLYSVFDSLLSNAINYSKPPRKIEIVYRCGTDDMFHHISVRDNGIGISPAALSCIFEPFQLADAAKLSRKYDRIGLSLSIAKKVIEMHGGDITVESAVNSGSTFTLHLPKEMKNDV